MGYVRRTGRERPALSRPRGLLGILTLAAVSCVLGSCAVGPNFKRPAAPTAKDYGVASDPLDTVRSEGPGGEPQRLVPGADLPAQWWSLYKSPALNALIERSLQDNADLKAAQAALAQAHELYKAQRASYLPSVQGGFAATRAKNAVGTIANPTSLPQTNPYYDLYTAELTVSYLPDVFGGTRRMVEAARAQEESSRFQLEATYLSLTANVVVTAIQEASLRGQIAATEQLLGLQHRLTETVRAQRSLGTASQLDILTQEAAEQQTAATLPPLEKQLGQTRDALTALLGRLPSEEPSERFDLDTLELPTDIPLIVPSTLIERRPDVRAAEANLHVASAEVGVAIADMLPQFNINGQWGSDSLALKQLFGPYTSFWQLGGSLTQALFDGGALLHRKRAADAALDQAAAQYRQAVILACQNVADALRALKADAAALHANTEAERAAKALLELTRRQHALGTVSAVALMAAEQVYRQAELSTVQARASRYADTAALFQALGGGWWNRAEESHRIASTGARHE
jgi:NodT family efflux transporter outer membrane factor (OMF) lipoprotein